MIRSLTQNLRQWLMAPRRLVRDDRRPHRRLESRPAIPHPIMLVMISLSLTSVIGYRFYDQPQLKEGTLAPKSVWASEDAEVVDQQLTDEQRKAAQTGLVQVLRVDATITQQMKQSLEHFLTGVEKMRETAGALPFVEEELLSLPSQRFLRSANGEDWQVVLRKIRANRPEVFEETGLNPDPSALLEPSTGVDGLATSPRSPFPVPRSPLPNTQPVSLVPDGYSPATTNPRNLSTQQAIAELELFRQQQGTRQLETLLETIEVVRLGYQQAQTLLTDVDPDAIEFKYQIALLDVRDETWAQTQLGLRQALDRILTQGIPPGLPVELRQGAAMAQLRSVVPDNTLPMGVELLTALIQPNLVTDKEETKRRAEQAAEAVEPVVYKVTAGEMIVRAGQTITRRDFILLDEFNESRRGIDWHGLGQTGGLVMGSIGIFWVVKRRFKVRLRCRDRILLCLLSLSTPLMLHLQQNNLAAVGLLGSSFFNPPLAITHVGLLTGLSIFTATPWKTAALVSWETIFAGAAGGLLAAVVAGRLRSREELALLGGMVGVTQGVLYFGITLFWSSTVGAVWAVVLPAAAVFGLAGLAWCIVALGLSPYLERLFDVVTPIRLAELSNPNRPLLKRLATEAPGTFQHTLFVASLAEAAARELHCNVELVRAGTLYHDIGKMHDPLGFIENQMGGPNKHDEINNPWESAEIIKKHVSEGLAIARRYNLPEAIQDFIPEHQGTILISYFYFQAKQRAQSEGVVVEEPQFRYIGPIPQSRETGIVMLADACEAALRSLKDATPETALSMVKKIFRARWQDHQLDESGLRWEELPTIAEVFVRVWQQYNHQRIAYPKAALDPQPITVGAKNLSPSP
ncbi:HDIG domain-containing protein [Spirulina sp. CCNP1310]|uniref:HD family phosphohydrolase n=1 Tax=Spirulina sp. CCNP1310 TaxID=3110249 RepID=UPI002B1F5A45|nr:HDIG domain-containing metalloprotein [Spirulina sp. CCNP1310]MEA5420132.1 HDIG domain-containing protein [Spirulina sp. CCNP1310]